MTKFYLYGHYDSRGGATLIEDDTKEAAHLRYAEMFCNEDTEWGTKKEQDERLIEEDFIGEVAFSAYREVDDGEDLEYGDPRPDEAADAGKANAFDDGLSYAPDEVSTTTPNPYRELLWERRNESDEVVELRLCPKNHHPAYEDQNDVPRPWFWSSKMEESEKKKQPGWKRSNLGEDACGVVIMYKRSYE